MQPIRGLDDELILFINHFFVEGDSYVFDFFREYFLVQLLQETRLSRRRSKLRSIDDEWINCFWIELILEIKFVTGVPQYPPLPRKESYNIFRCIIEMDTLIALREWNLRRRNEARKFYENDNKGRKGFNHYSGSSQGQEWIPSSYLRAMSEEWKMVWNICSSIQTSSGWLDAWTVNMIARTKIKDPGFYLRQYLRIRIIFWNISGEQSRIYKQTPMNLNDNCKD